MSDRKKVTSGQWPVTSHSNMLTTNHLAPGVFDAGIAGVLVRGAAAVYGEAREMEGWAEEQECERQAVVRDQATDTLAFVAARRDCGFVVFRGTRDVRNWITDVDCGLRIADCGLGKVHEGFARALGSVVEEVEEILAGWEDGVRTVFFAGHSLGGALAMLAGARMAVASDQWPVTRRPVTSDQQIGVTSHSSNLVTNHWIYTFGQPRVGNRAWAGWYDGRLRERSFRVVHADDIVPRVPWLLGTFSHAGHEVFFPRTEGTEGTEGTYGTGETGLMDPSWVRKLRFDFGGLWRRRRPDLEALLADHHVSAYARILNGEC